MCHAKAVLVARSIKVITMPDAHTVRRESRLSLPFAAHAISASYNLLHNRPKFFYRGRTFQDRSL
jgi:hypothetical protein